MMEHHKFYVDHRRRPCVFGCDIVGIHLHKFPNPETRPDIFVEWMSAVGDKLTETNVNKIYANKRVCDRHFNPEDKTGGHHLTCTAIPVLNLQGVQRSINTTIDSEHNYCIARMTYPAGKEMSTVTLSNTEPKLYPKLDDLQLALGQTQCDKQNTNENKIFNIPAGAWEAVENDVNVENDIRFGLRLDPGETNNEEENSHSLPTLYTNYTECDRANKTEDSHVNAGLKLESGVSESEIFSWNKTCDIVPEADDDADVLYEVFEDSDEVSIRKENLSQQQNCNNLKEIKKEDVTKKNEHVGFKCNGCKNTIAGYRYSCVQCDDYDICSRCEARGVHSQHYMLRVPGPRPYEEVQSMLQLIRRQLFQSDIILKSSDADDGLRIPEESIKLEKQEVEEVDPLESTMLPASVSPLFGRPHKLEDTGQDYTNETDATSTIELRSDNVPYRFTSRHNRRTYKPRKRKPHNFNESVVESTADKPSVNVSTKRAFSDEPKYFQQINSNQDIDELDKQCRIDMPLTNDATKRTRSEQPTQIPRKRKLQDSNEEYTKDLPSKNVLSNPTLKVLQHFPHKIKTKQERRESNGTKHNDAINPKVVLSRLPIELVNKEYLFESEKLREDNVPNVASTVNVESNALTVDKVANVASTGKLVTPEYLGLSKMNLKEMFNIDVQNRKRILIRIDTIKGQSPPMQPRNVITPQTR